MLKKGEKCRITEVCADGALKRRFYDIGLTEDVVVQFALCAPFGDPLAYVIRGAVIAIRRDDGKKVKCVLEPLAKERRRI
jgi:ferrous iron transport protein A